MCIRDSITSLSRIEEDRYVRLDKFTVRSLELLGSLNEGGTSLLDVIDRTISPMGALSLIHILMDEVWCLRHSSSKPLRSW